MPETETHYSSTTTSPSPAASAQGFLKDVILWRRKQLSVLTLVISTITWVLLEAYKLNFVTVASWACMLTISTIFLLDSLLKLLGKEESAGKLWRWQVTEETTEAVAMSVKEVMEEGVRWMLRVSNEMEWYVFAGTVGLLFVISKVVAFFDLLSLLYTGSVVSMTVSVLYMKYEEKIKRYGEGLKGKWRRMCEMFDDRVVSKVKGKFAIHVKNDKVE